MCIPKCEFEVSILECCNYFNPGWVAGKRVVKNCEETSNVTSGYHMVSIMKATRQFGSIDAPVLLHKSGFLALGFCRLR